jgi:hypothetical protein
LPRATDVHCGAQQCQAHETDYQNLALPPCCTDADSCGVEPGRLARIYGPLVLAFIPACNAPADLFAPAADSMPCTHCDDACPTVFASDVPIVGDLELPGCCRSGGTCGVSNLGLPLFAAGPPTCLDQIGLASLLGSTSPDPPIAVAPNPCTPSSP